MGAASALNGLTARAASADGATGNVTQAQARDNMRAVDTGMRTDYDALRARLINHLDPVIVVNNDMQGGTYYLISNGQVLEKVQPVDEVFELAKSIAHTPLGIYSICAASLDPRTILPAQASYIDPHDLRMVAFNGPGDTSWIQPLQDFANTLRTARKTLEAAGLPGDAQGSLHDSCAHILDRADDFISDTIRSRSFDMRSFEDFAGDVYPSVRTNMYWSSRKQIDGVSALMTRWRKQVGDTAWSGLYVVVLSIWTTYVQNQNSIILKNFMNQHQVSTHLIDLMTAQTPSDPVHVALDNLARIVMDNVAAEMVFSADQPTADALKGQPDLLSTEILRLLGNGTAADTASTLTKGQTNQIVCPFHNRSATTAAAV
ncbi:hypothetical protein [Streptomyces puniciscabiei]|uniref:hypothetical protein n=1 Tax=Streptomyces puniciscabiei TaxID=164348 RepID=UPI0018FEAA3E|nr:hypothetical protein [Streptomyces puniciscabiei]